MAVYRSESEILSLLDTIPDPEVPAISIVELGIIRNITVQSEDTIEVSVTPTYSGCPAMSVIISEIEQTLRKAGFQKITVHTLYAPPWTTDWISPEAQAKLKQYGIAPPGQGASTLVNIKPKDREVACPFCSSRNTELRSEFGATACKSFYYCKECLQPFEFFKPH